MNHWHHGVGYAIKILHSILGLPFPFFLVLFLHIMLPRLKQTLSHLAPPGADGKQLPKYDELPRFNELQGCAWDLWGKGDQLGTVNLLTNAVVQQAAQEVKSVHVNLTAKCPM